jgi:hypothetical protein
MKICIVDDSIKKDWESSEGKPISVLAEIVNTLKTCHSVSLSGFSLMRKPPPVHDFAFITSSADTTTLQTLLGYDVLLIDYSLRGHDDKEGLKLATDLVTAGFPAWRIMIVSRHKGQSLDGDVVNGILVRDKTSPNLIALWLKERMNSPSRQIVASAIIDKHLNYRTPIDNAFHGWPLDLIADAPCPIEEFSTDLKQLGVTVCPELDVLGGDPENGLIGFRSMLRGRAQNYLQTLYPSPTVERATWNNLKTKLNLDSADLSVPPIGASITLRDWAFPRTDSNDTTGLCSALFRNAWARAKEQGLEFDVGIPNWMTGKVSTNAGIKHALPFTCYLDFFDTNFLPNAAEAGAMCWKVYAFKKIPSRDEPLPCFLVIECRGKPFASRDFFQNFASKLFARLRTYCHVLTSAKCNDGCIVIELLPNTRDPRSIASHQVEYDGINLNFATAHSGDVTSTYVFILDGKP